MLFGSPFFHPSFKMRLAWIDRCQCSIAYLVVHHFAYSLLDVPSLQTASLSDAEVPEAYAPSILLHSPWVEIYSCPIYLYWIKLNNLREWYGCFCNSWIHASEMRIEFFSSSPSGALYLLSWAPLMMSFIYCLLRVLRTPKKKLRSGSLFETCFFVGKYFYSCGSAIASS